MEQRVLTRLRTNYKLVQKIGTILPLQDRELAGHKIPKTGRTLKSVKEKPLMSWKKSSGTKHKGRPPLHSFNELNVQKLTGQIIWPQSGDTVLMLLQIFQM